MLGGVSRANVSAALGAIAKDKGAVTANRARAALSAFFRWAIGEGLCDHNPVTGTNKQRENGPRERVLSDAELAATWLAAPDSDYGRILQLLILTGCRRDEIGSLKWSEIDMGARAITLCHSRTRRLMWSKSETVLDKAVGLKEDCTLHDLRRTVRTGLGKLGVQPHVAEAVLTICRRNSFPLMTVTPTRPRKGCARSVGNASQG
jgi:integrase